MKTYNKFLFFASLNFLAIGGLNLWAKGPMQNVLLSAALEDADYDQGVGHDERKGRRSHSARRRRTRHRKKEAAQARISLKSTLEREPKKSRVRKDRNDNPYNLFLQNKYNKNNNYFAKIMNFFGCSYLWRLVLPRSVGRLKIIGSYTVKSLFVFVTVCGDGWLVYYLYNHRVDVLKNKFIKEKYEALGKFFGRTDEGDVKNEDSSVLQPQLSLVPYDSKKECQSAKDLFSDFKPENKDEGALQHGVVDGLGLMPSYLPISTT